MCYFDADGDGMMDSTEFVTNFFKFKCMSRVVNPKVPDAVVHGPKGGGGWTSAMPPIGRPTTVGLFPREGSLSRGPLRHVGLRRGDVCMFDLRRHSMISKLCVGFVACLICDDIQCYPF